MEHKPMVSYQKIGIDKIQFSNIAVIEIDIPHLMQHSSVSIEQASNPTRPCRRRIPGSETGITKIKIKDNDIFSDLTIGSANDSNGVPIEYVYLSLVIPDFSGSNLIPWHWVDYNAYLENVFQYIETEYHIQLFAEDMKINYLEVNSNIPLSEDFCHYDRAIRLIMSLMSNHMGKLSSYDSIQNSNGNKSMSCESFKRGNDSIDVIFYDKLKELNDTNNNYEGIDTPILRIEYRLKSKKKIKDVFHTRLWKELDDEKIAEFFIVQIRTQLADKFEKWKLQTQKELRKLIKNCRAESVKNWHHLLMQNIRNKSEITGLPFILDIEQVYDAVKSFPHDKNTDRKCKSIASIHITDDVYKNHDLQKVQEIFDGAELAYKNTIELYYSQF